MDKSKQVSDAGIFLFGGISLVFCCGGGLFCLRKGILKCQNSPGMSYKLVDS